MTKPILSPINVPWAISPSISGVRLAAREDGDAVIDANVYSASAQLPAERVRITLVGGQWIRTEPVIDDGSEMHLGRFDRSLIAEVPWSHSGTCGDPRVYRVTGSWWLREVGAERFGCCHFVIAGRELWLEVLARRLHWEWLLATHSVASEFSEDG